MPDPWGSPRPGLPSKAVPALTGLTGLLHHECVVHACTSADARVLHASLVRNPKGALHLDVDQRWISWSTADIRCGGHACAHPAVASGQQMSKTIQSACVGAGRPGRA